MPNVPAVPCENSPAFGERWQVTDIALRCPPMSTELQSSSLSIEHPFARKVNAPITSRIRQNNFRSFR